MLQGGIAYNPGIVSAFRQRYEERLQISPVFAVSGAFGAALLAAENIPEAREAFRPVRLRPLAESRVVHEQRALGDALLLKDYSPIGKPGQKTVGIPYALMMHKFSPWPTLFLKA